MNMWDFGTGKHEKKKELGGGTYLRGTNKTNNDTMTMIGDAEGA
jgi:hypothetical protein